MMNVEGRPTFNILGVPLSRIDPGPTAPEDEASITKPSRPVQTLELIAVCHSCSNNERGCVVESFNKYVRAHGSYEVGEWGTRRQ